jgi:hypothetical protein
MLAIIPAASRPLGCRLAVVTDSRRVQMRSSTFSFEGARVVSIIVLMAANAV